jgi:ribonuclease HII
MKPDKLLEEQIVDQYDNEEVMGFLDEVGCGSLFGPVVACCVVLPRNWYVPELVDDSKKITNENKRKDLAGMIKEHALAYAFGMATTEEIESLNILWAARLAMKRAYQSVCNNCNPTYLYVDGNKEIPDIEVEQETVVKGDSKVFGISCASILAKVHRDEMIRKVAQIYPYSLYDLEKNKGYGTKIHIERLNTFGVSNMHRRDFEPVKSLLALNALYEDDGRIDE